MNKVIIARGPGETEEIGVDLAADVSDGTVVSLVGELGAGKTTFVKGLAKGLLVTDAVVSPSYLLARDYVGRLSLHHIDAYRLDSVAELAEVGLDELFPPQEGVTAIEWPERIDGIIDISDILVRIEVVDLETRRVTVTRR